MATTYNLITSNVLGSSAASVTFSSIPATYTDLVVQASMRTDRVDVLDIAGITFSSDTSTNYSATTLYGNGASVTSSIRSNFANVRENTIIGNSGLSNTFGSFEMYIPNYLISASKPFSGFMVTENNSSTSGTAIVAVSNLWRNTATISSMNFFPITGPNFLTGSSFYLYGIKNS
jgi:hypothetical protein